MNLTKSFLVLAALLFAQSGFAADLQQLPTHIGGRVLVSSNIAGEKSYEYSWPSIYFETVFKGDSLMLKFDDDQNILQLIVDGNAPIIVNKPGKQDYVVQGLTDGKHHVRLEKLRKHNLTPAAFMDSSAMTKLRHCPKENAASNLLATHLLSVMAIPHRARNAPTKMCMQLPIHNSPLAHSSPNILMLTTKSMPLPVLA